LSIAVFECKAGGRNGGERRRVKREEKREEEKEERREKINTTGFLAMTSLRMDLYFSNT
jgi:hypothetical protein